MSKLTSSMFNKFVLMLTVIAFGLACGGGGGGGGSDIASSGSVGDSIRAKLFAAKLANLKVGDTVYLYKLDDPNVIDQQIELTAANIEDGISIVFEFDVDYQMILKRNNVHFLQTLITKEQITTASQTGNLNIGLLNSVTTYITHMVNLELQSSTTDSSQAIDNVLAKYFVGVEDLSGFDFNNFFTAASPIELTDLFYSEAANRINALSGYVDIMSDIDPSSITTANADTMQDLFNEILTGTINNWSVAAQVADDEFDFDVTGFEDGIKDILFDNGETTNYVLDEADLRVIFFDPVAAQNLTLFDLVVETPDSTITGVIEGSGIDGVDVYAIETDNNGNEIVAFTTKSDSLGQFSFDGLNDTTYKLKVSKAGYIYRGKAISASNITIEGFDLAGVVDAESIVVVGGKLTLGDNVSHAVSFNNDLTVTGQANLSGILHPTSAGTAGQFLRIGADGNLYFDTFTTITGGLGVSQSDARDNLGLGSIATQDASGVSITGGNLSGITDATISNLIAGGVTFPTTAGTNGYVLKLNGTTLEFQPDAGASGVAINGTTIGLTTAAAGNFTSVSLDTLSANTVDIDSGTIDGTSVGATVGSTGNFTTLDSTGAANLNSLATYSVNINGYMLPTADGTNGQALVTQGNGYVTFQSVDITGTTVSDLTVTNFISSNVAISGGNIDGAAIGAITPITTFRATSANIDTSFNLNGDATIGSTNTNTLRINSSVYGSTSTGNVEVAGNLISSDNTFTLGVAAHPWSAIYAIDLVTTSDSRLKKDVEPLNYGLTEVMKLRPVSYEWKNRHNKERTIGLLAQEVEVIMDEVVSTADDEIGSRGVKYVNMVPVLIKAIQDQQKIIDEQKLQLSAQRERLNKLEETIGK